MPPSLVIPVDHLPDYLLQSGLEIMAGLDVSSPTDANLVGMAFMAAYLSPPSGLSGVGHLTSLVSSSMVVSLPSSSAWMVGGLPAVLAQAYLPVSLSHLHYTDLGCLHGGFHPTSASLAPQAYGPTACSRHQSCLGGAGLGLCLAVSREMVIMVNGHLHLIPAAMGGPLLPFPLQDIPCVPLFPCTMLLLMLPRWMSCRPPPLAF